MDKHFVPALMELHVMYEQLVAIVPAFFIVLFAGPAFSDYAHIFRNNSKRKKKDQLPGMDDQIDEWIGRNDSNSL